MNSQIALWKDADDLNSFRHLKQNVSDEELLKIYRGKTFKAIV
jgi:hypothetical protein